MRRILTAAERVAFWHQATEILGHDGVFWHGTPSGDLRGGQYGLHVGTYQAASEALEARIGRRADGKPWDGTQAYGDTPLDQDRHSHRWHPDTRTWTHEVTRMPPALPTGRATYGDGTPVPLDARPSVVPVRIVGPMSNTPNNPHPDWKANGYMHAQLTRGRARRGYYYTNEGEGVATDPLTGNIKYSISAVVPNGDHLQLLSHDDQPFPPRDWMTHDTGYNAEPLP